MSSQRDRVCAVCGKAIAKHRLPSTKYCDAGCRYQAEYNKRVAGREPLLRDCAWCGVTFDARPPTGGGPMRYCTTNCRVLADKKRRARRKAELRKQAQPERDCLDCGTPIGQTRAVRCSACGKERARALRRKRERATPRVKKPTAFTIASKPVDSYDPRKYDRKKKTTSADIDSWITATGNRKLPADPLEALKVVLAEHEDFREAFADVNGI